MSMTMNNGIFIFSGEMQEFKKYKNYPISDTWSSGPNAYFNGSTVTSPE